MPVISHKNLHSNMDRFERTKHCLTVRIWHIYIPIWIDLKERNLRNGKVRNRHLHSNMDRFESSRRPSFLFGKNIYIPIWIDLKAERSWKVLAAAVIYIPIWIDLKAAEPTPKGATPGHLHSNMDRFESIQNICNIPTNIINLHSNMDRFERVVRLHGTVQTANLHSNMDRFES